MHSRRDTLKLAGLATAWTVVQPFNETSAQQAPPRTRFDIGDLAPDHKIIQSYAEAVRRMKALPPSDRRSWVNQANIHRDSCPHINWYFLPWHRAYLHAFEDIVREMSQDADFTLPYWDWATTPTLPSVFRSPQLNNQPNPLHDGTRLMTVNQGQPLGAPFGSPDEFNEEVVNGHLAVMDFVRFGSGMPQGQNSTDAQWQKVRGAASGFELGPHGMIHVYTGGNMSRTTTAGLDPIFWLHHCNIDRIWARWSAQGRRNPSSDLWQKFRFERDFVGANGQVRPYEVRETNTTTGLGYRYDDVPPDTQFVASAPFSTMLSLEARRIASLTQPAGQAVRSGQVSAVQFTLPTQVNEIVRSTRTSRSRFSANLPPQPGLIESLAPAASPRVFARIKNLSTNDAADLVVRIFLNCDYLNLATPVGDPRYVATVSLFGIDHHAGHGTGAPDAGQPSVLVELTSTLDNLRRLGEPVEQRLDFQLLGVPTRQGAPPASVGYDEVEIIVA